jgi:hypothetical protein
MSIFVQLDPVPWEILDRVRARILANRRENNREQQQVARPQRTATRARFNEKNQNYRRPEASAPLPSANMFLAWEGTLESVIEDTEIGVGLGFSEGTRRMRIAVASPNGKTGRMIDSGEYEFLAQASQIFSSPSPVNQTWNQKGAIPVSRWFPAPNGIIHTAAIFTYEYNLTIQYPNSNSIAWGEDVLTRPYTVDFTATPVASQTCYIKNSECIVLSDEFNHTKNRLQSAITSEEVTRYTTRAQPNAQIGNPSNMLEKLDPDVAPWQAVYKLIPGQSDPPVASPANYVSNDVDIAIYETEEARDAAFAAAYELQLQSRDPELPPRRLRYQSNPTRPTLSDVTLNEVFTFTNQMIAASDFGLTSYVRSMAANFGVR